MEKFSEGKKVGGGGGKKTDENRMDIPASFLWLLTCLHLTFFAFFSEEIASLQNLSAERTFTNCLPCFCLDFCLFN